MMFTCGSVIGLAGEQQPALLDREVLPVGLVHAADVNLAVGRASARPAARAPSSWPSDRRVEAVADQSHVARTSLLGRGSR